MMRIIRSAEDKLSFETFDFNQPEIIQQGAWLDLFCPTSDEINSARQLLGINLPNQQEMYEIELSSRLFQDETALHMTISLIACADQSEPQSDSVRIIITEQQLITIRYHEFKAFKLFENNLQQTELQPIAMLLALIDACIERLADIIEMVGRTSEECSKKIFCQQSSAIKANQAYQNLLIKLGGCGDLISKTSDSLVSLQRLMHFFEQTTGRQLQSQQSTHAKVITEDIISLNYHTDFLANKVTFLLDATLGMINIEQNNTIKIFSVVSVVLMPPTLIASIYGMNFHYIPELAFKFGYYCCLMLMGLSAWVPYRYFKKKKWL